jgi:hypothetical protein
MSIHEEIKNILDSVRAYGYSQRGVDQHEIEMFPPMTKEEFLSKSTSAIIQIIRKGMPGKRVHSQLCKRSVGNSFGKDGNFEKNCGCIAYGFNRAITEFEKCLEGK